MEKQFKQCNTMYSYSTAQNQKHKRLQHNSRNSSTQTTDTSDKHITLQEISNY